MEENRKDEHITKNKKKIITDIGNTKFIINLHYKEGGGENYKDKVLKLIKRETEKYPTEK